MAGEKKEGVVLCLARVNASGSIIGYYMPEVDSIDATAETARLLVTDPAIAPTVNTPLGAKTAQAAWDNGDELTIPADTEFLHVYTDEDVYLLVNSLTADPAGSDPAIYVGGATHVIPCRGNTKLHFKRASGSNAALAVSAFGA